LGVTIILIIIIIIINTVFIMSRLQCKQMIGGAVREREKIYRLIHTATRGSPSMAGMV